MIVDRFTVIAPICTYAVILFGIMVGQGVAVTEIVETSVPGSVIGKTPYSPIEPKKKLRHARVKGNGGATVIDQSTVVTPKSVKRPSPESKPGTPKGLRRLKVNKKISPKAVLRPRTDLAYHGMLEDSQRYDPRLNHRTAGVQDPRTPDLAHDHFQELDHNQDGRIDPVERAFGRLDMDRDLPNNHH